MSIHSTHDYATGRGGPGGRGADTGSLMYGSTPTKGRLLLATPPLEDPTRPSRDLHARHAMTRAHAAASCSTARRSEELGDALRAVDSDEKPTRRRCSSRARRPPDSSIAVAGSTRAPASTMTTPTPTSTHLAPLNGDLAFGRPRRRPRRLSVDVIRATLARVSGATPAGADCEGEIEAGAWHVLDPEPDDVFTPGPRRPLARRAAPPARPPPRGWQAPTT